uniref:Palmitoyltransferase n=1 Tax=Amorphochlora amoebiformis TaxID=1561963 RepID=A0A7S0H426_9EUKA
MSEYSHHRISNNDYSSDEKETLDDDERDIELEESGMFFSEFAEGQPGKKGPCGAADWVCCCCSRVGNMHVILETMREGKRKILCVMGPFWPCTILITYPIFTLVGLGLGHTFWVVGYPLPLLIVWYVVVGFVLSCLGLTACCDPGILRRQSKRMHSDWIWTKQTSSFRPRKAVYCRDCNCVIEEYDHVCPWTGTAIGKRNMCFFQAFVSSCAIMFVFAIVVVVAGSLFTAHHHTK